MKKLFPPILFIAGFLFSNSYAADYGSISDSDQNYDFEFGCYNYYNFWVGDKKTSEIRDKTIEAIESTDAPMVAFRFLQAKSYKNYSKMMAAYSFMGSGTLGIGAAYLILSPDAQDPEDTIADKAGAFAAIGVGACWGVQMSGNIKSLSKSISYSKRFLNVHLSDIQMEVLERINFDLNGMLKLGALFDDEEYVSGSQLKDRLLKEFKKALNKL